MTRLWVLLAVAVWAIAACSRGQPARVQQARRIVSLAPSMTEALFAIGVGDRVVGRTRFCDFPPEALTLPVVGDVAPDVEAILELHPDLVVGLGGAASARLSETLAAHAIASWFPETSSLGVDEVMQQLGQRTGHTQDALDIVQRLREHEHAIERAVAGEPRPRVAMVVQLAPIVAAGPKSFVNELIWKAGGRNAVVDGAGWSTIGFEKILELDPDVILDATPAGTEDAIRISAQVPGWSGVRAVREGHVVPLRDERVLRAGPRMAEGLAVLARALHPGAPVP